MNTNDLFGNKLYKTDEKSAITKQEILVEHEILIIKEKADIYLKNYNVPLDKYVFSGHKILSDSETDEINGFEFIYTYRTKNENRTIAVWYEFNHGLSCEGHPYINERIDFNTI